MKKVINRSLDKTLQLLSMDQMADNWPDIILQTIINAILAAAGAFLAVAVVLGGHLLVGPVAPLIISILVKTGVESLLNRGV